MTFCIHVSLSHKFCNNHSLSCQTIAPAIGSGAASIFVMYKAFAVNFSIDTFFHRH